MKDQAEYDALKAKVEKARSKSGRPSTPRGKGGASADGKAKNDPKAKGRQSTQSPRPKVFTFMAYPNKGQICTIENCDGSCGKSIHVTPSAFAKMKSEAKEAKKKFDEKEAARLASPRRGKT